MMMVPAYVSCSESSGFVTRLYALTQFNTNELTLTLTHDIVDLYQADIGPVLRYLEAGWLLATPTSSWQHHIESQCAFPQQLLQISKIFSLRPPIFLSIKTNELTLIRSDLALPLQAAGRPHRSSRFELLMLMYSSMCYWC